ncbi:MAG TPA: DUF2059 domain-containing protein [Paucimonas sp.]|nr:DUF2059 domain-containing protein [Paucimonas sp.]
MKKLLITLSLAVLPVFAHAAAPSAESIEKLMTITKSQNMVESIAPQMEGRMKSMMEQGLELHKLAPAEKEKANAFIASFVAKSMAVVKDEMSWKNMREMYVQIYGESFTQEEIDGLIAFYASPAGKAFVEKMPMVMQKSMLATQQRFTPLMKKLRDVAQQSAAEYKQTLAAKDNGKSSKQ